MFQFQRDTNVIPTTTPTVLPAQRQTKQNLPKPWFLSSGTEYPTNFQGVAKLFPDEDDGDRIVEQLMYVPEDYQGKGKAD